MRYVLPSAALLLSLGLAPPLAAQSLETSNGCQATADDPCVRTGSCSIQMTTWDQVVRIDRSDPYDTLGWAGLCDQVHVALVQNRCLSLSSGEILVLLSTGSRAWVSDVQGALGCSLTAPAATAVPFNGTGLNVPVLTADPVVPGGAWTAALQPWGHGSPGHALLLLRGGFRDPGPILSIQGGPATELLVSGAVYADLLIAHDGEAGPPALFTTTLPADLSLLGTPWALQAGVLSTYADLSTAVRGVAGS